MSKSAAALLTALLLSIAGCQKGPEAAQAAAPASAAVAAEDAAKGQTPPVDGTPAIVKVG